MRPPTRNRLLLVTDPPGGLRCSERIRHDVLQHIEKILGDQPLRTLDEQRHRARWFGVLEERRHGVEGTNRVLARADYSDRAGRGTALRCARAVGPRGRRVGPCSNLRAHDLVNAFQLMAQTDEFFFIRAAVEVRGCLHPAAAPILRLILAHQTNATWAATNRARQSTRGAGSKTDFNSPALGGPAPPLVTGNKAPGK